MIPTTATGFQTSRALAGAALLPYMITIGISNEIHQAKPPALGRVYLLLNEVMHIQQPYSTSNIAFNYNMLIWHYLRGLSSRIPQIIDKLSGGYLDLIIQDSSNFR